MIRLTTLAEGIVRRVVRGRIDVSTSDPGFTDITGAATEFTAENGAIDGILCAFVRHTTASLTIQENADPIVQDDLLDALDRLAPRGARYRHDTEGPDDMPGHIKAMLSDTSVVLPVTGGRMGLGQWQAIYLVEHRAGRRQRSVDLTYVGT